MHTTNNVPQSRCRTFLIYGELSEMGRWSKRRWRHAEGLHFSLFSPHKQEKAVSVCHNTHKHTPTHTAQRRERTHKRRHAQPPLFTCTLHTAAIISTTDAWTRAHAFQPPPPLFFPVSLSPAIHNKTHMDTSSAHTSTCTTN